MLTVSQQLGATAAARLAGAALLGAVLVGSWGASEAFGQDTSPTGPGAVLDNPLARDAEAVRAGRGLYLDRCAVCHGQDAKGSMAANLIRSRAVVRGSDAALFRVLRRGIPGTEMPPQADLGENEVWQIVSYLHSLARPGLQPPVAGNAAAGRILFRTVGCAGCHRVDGEGGFWGPALDSVAARKTSGQIRLDILEPGSAVGEGYRSVIVRAADGRRIEGLLKNQDTFTVQILQLDGAYVSLSRSEIREIRASVESPMPSQYGQTLGEGQLQDLLAFLDRQRDAFVPFDRGFGNY